MSEERTKRIVRLLILSWAFVMILIASLAFLLFLAFRDTSHTLRKANEEIAQLRAVQPIVGKDGKDAVVDYAQIDTAIDQKLDQKIALLPKPKDGRDGRDSISTVTIIEKALPGPQGPQGLPGLTPRVPIFDGMGHYKYPDDDEWLPLFQEAE